MKLFLKIGLKMGKVGQERQSREMNPFKVHYMHVQKYHIESPLYNSNTLIKILNKPSNE
jgi:hypothetical protein